MELHATALLTCNPITSGESAIENLINSFSEDEREVISCLLKNLLIVHQFSIADLLIVGLPQPVSVYLEPCGATWLCSKYCSLRCWISISFKLILSKSYSLLGPCKFSRYN